MDAAWPPLGKPAGQRLAELPSGIRKRTRHNPGWCGACAVSPSSVGQVEVSQLMNGRQGISGREQQGQRSRGEREHGRKLRPQSLERGPLAQLVLIKHLPTPPRPSSQKDGTWNMLSQEACVRMAKPTPVPAPGHRETGHLGHGRAMSRGSYLRPSHH